MLTNKQSFTVTELTRYVRDILGQNSVLKDLWVRGEISNFKHHSSGHMYFTLKDQGSSLRCVMFKNRNQALDFNPQDGMNVVARGSVGVFERAGLYQLYVDELKPDGIGDLHQAFEKLKQQLREEGLFDDRTKKPLPKFPTKVAIITSPTGAAVRDMVVTITRRFPRVELVIVPVRVQGDKAANEISYALELADKVLEPDVILTGRGGGSLEELWPFNEEVVARTIFKCSTPVISCVGHETDITISDFVADVRAPTPTAAGEIIVPDKDEIQKDIQEYKSRMVVSLKNKVVKLKDELDDLKERHVLKDPHFIVEERRKELDYYYQLLLREKYHYFKDKKQRLSSMIDRLEALSPLAVLKRGYSMCEKGDGRIIESVNNISINEKIRVNFKDGKADCKVENLYSGEEGQEE
ncbi:exodeoxyribonuclease VII large subunit [Natranaerofaba carboxydovora]|uniref:exodeoxyribonuclease VII large subunit n=1 Tax=Natranaerofaba carboxydovora TaxID=2742683 RepID=UPI001F147521|nr:exodeoxyribonuclease VII large subunit [Natranaerofaba carboxydovora]UMZ73949.1 Exodeoxyribonuclease 7 large subunit [Natranaerofaba carboxydovora]